MIVDLLYDLPADGPDVRMTLADVLGTVLVGPALETLLMSLILVLITKFTDRIFLGACFCAFIFSILHSMSYPLWGMFTFIPFVVFGVAFQVWRQSSPKVGFTIAFLIHALHNSYVLLVGMLGQ
ncbi:CPBP family intramembrane metalloprotease [Vibrio cholerae]|nr:CPBP family intramembrane metalloprotease [Vibrio cholerae]